MKKETIALLGFNMDTKGGQERVSINLANELSNRYEVILITWFKNILAYELDKKVKYIFLLENKTKLRKSFFYLTFKLKSIINEKKIDKIIVVGRYASIISFSAIIGNNCKLILWEHNSLKGYNIFYNTFKRRVHSNLILLGYRLFANRIVFLTKNDAERYKKKLFVRKKCIVNIYNWLDDKLLLDNTKLRYAINSKKIITVGRIDYQKGYEYLVEIARNVFEKHPDWEWHIYGRGDVNYELKIKNMIKKYNLENKLILKGNVDNLYDLYKNYSFLVMTSRYEGFGMVLLEAKAKKIPALSYNIESGPSDIINNNIDGFLIKPFDIVEMTNKICEMIEKPKLRKFLSDNTYIFLNKFSKKKILNQWYRLIDSI